MSRAAPSLLHGLSEGQTKFAKQKKELLGTVSRNLETSEGP